MTDFSPEDLLEYYYGDCTPQRKQEIAAALKANWTLREKLLVISKAAERLEKSLCSPSQQVVERIMSYARNSTKVLLD